MLVFDTKKKNFTYSLTKIKEVAYKSFETGTSHDKNTLQWVFSNSCSKGMFASKITI